jgi:hypothetical protein
VLSARPATVRLELPVPRPLAPADAATWEEEIVQYLA